MFPQTPAEDKQSGHVVSVINCYFMSQGGAMFRAQVESFPYLYLQVKVNYASPPCDSSCACAGESSGPLRSLSTSRHIQSCCKTRRVPAMQFR